MSVSAATQNPQSQGHPFITANNILNTPNLTALSATIGAISLAAPLTNTQRFCLALSLPIALKTVVFVASRFTHVTQGDKAFHDSVWNGREPPLQRSTTEALEAVQKAAREKKEYEPKSVDNARYLELLDQQFEAFVALAKGINFDLKQWTNWVKQGETPLTSSAELITYQGRVKRAGSKYDLRSSWMFRVFFYLPSFYQRLYTQPGSSDDASTDWKKNWQDKFFEEAAQQYKWRTQWNEWVKEFYTVVDRGQLERCDDRFVRWIQEHTKPDQFQTAPDTIPT